MLHHNLPCPTSRVVIGLSGGADSVCLLRIMHALGYECVAVHCNFHLRGEESNRDESFVRDLCKTMDIPLYCTDFNTEEYAKERHIGIEQAARDLRYRYFEEIRVKASAAYIAVAHHRDDNVETLLWNMVRGTGIRGLRGMLPQNGCIIRPLLCLSKNDILEYLQAIGQDFVTDCTNLIDDVTRNKIRLNIIPRLQELNPQAQTNIGQLMENMQEVWKIYQFHIQDMQRRCVTEKDGVTTINLSKIDDFPSVSTFLFEILSPIGFNRHQIAGMLTADSGKIFTSATLSDKGIHEARIKADKKGRRILVSRKSE